MHRRTTQKQYTSWTDARGLKNSPTSLVLQRGKQVNSDRVGSAAAPGEKPPLAVHLCPGRRETVLDSNKPVLFRDGLHNPTPFCQARKAVTSFSRLPWIKTKFCLARGMFNYPALDWIRPEQINDGFVGLISGVANNNVHGSKRLFFSF
ncbi:hypothetical protein E4U54_007953 [Claviceps lovelessii]|nr:hypothetical protein E4U54_007953 [Claviceps lovelessii]